MKRILLIDDEAGIRELWKRFHEVTEQTFQGQLGMDTASDLDKGIELIAQNEYDAIIIDYHLPPLDGNMLEKWIRDNYQSLPPIVVLTGDHDVWIRRRCLMSGAEDFWLKVDAGNTPNQFFKAVYNAYLRRKKYVGNNETTHIQ